MNATQKRMLRQYFEGLGVGSVRTFRVIYEGSQRNLVIKKVTSNFYGIGILAQGNTRSASNLPNGFWRGEDATARYAIGYNVEAAVDIIFDLQGVIANNQNRRPSKNARTGNYSGPWNTNENELSRAHKKRR